MFDKEWWVLLVKFLSTWGKPRHSWRKSMVVDLGSSYAYRAFSWLLAVAGGPRPLWWVPSLGMWSWDVDKADWTNQREEASEQHSTVICALVPASGSCPDSPQWWTVTWEWKDEINLSFPSHFWSWPHHSNKTLTKAMCMCVYMYVHVYVCAHVCVCVCVCLCVCVECVVD